MTPEQLKALKAAHPVHAGLLVDMFVAGKSEAECLAAITAADSEALRAEVGSLTTKLGAAELRATTAEAKATDLAAKLATAETQIARFQATGALTDPGGAPHTPAVVATDEAGWRAEFKADPALREEFGQDADAYVAFNKSLVPSNKAG